MHFLGSAVFEKINLEGVTFVPFIFAKDRPPLESGIAAHRKRMGRRRENGFFAHE